MGLFNPWVLLASGKIEHVDQKDLKRMDGVDDTARLGDMVNIGGTRKQGVVIGVDNKPRSGYVDDIADNFSKTKRKEIFRELKNKPDIKARKAVIQSGVSTAELRKSIPGIKPKNFQAHHIIPRETKKKFGDFFQKIGFNIENGAKNGNMVPPDDGVLKAAIKNDPNAAIFSNSVFHKGSHPDYTKRIEVELRKIRRQLEKGQINSLQAHGKVQTLQNNAKIAIGSSRGVPMNDVLF